MRLKHLTISALSLSIFFSANVYGGEDVIVDLSVLNSLQPSTAPMPSYGKSEKPQPLFPIVKKETAKTKKAEQASPSQSKTKKTIAKKVQQQPSIVKSKDKALASDSPKKETLKIIETAKTENSEIKPQKQEQIKVETQVNVSQDQIPVENEKITAVQQAEAKRQQAASAASSHTVLKKEENKVVAEKVTESNSLLSPQPRPKNTDLLISSVPAADGIKQHSKADMSNGKAELSTKVEEKTVLSQNQAVLPQQDNSVIVFAEGEDVLTPEQQKQITSLISTFKDADKNKISIIAYNLDDGENVFQRKRTSLNRAVNIRSHLLSMGYKNYSIKVINVNSGDERINTVKITELQK